MKDNTVPRSKSSGYERRLEASGVPRRGDTSPELAKLVARRLGIVPPLESGRLPVPEKTIDIQLGNPDLPVHAYKEIVKSAFENNQVVVCVAETGSGKSTQIPQILLEAGYDVVLTQPRRLAAELLSKRITNEVTEVLGPDGYGLVGFQTAERGNLTDDTRVQVVTDGLQLVRELGVLDDNKGLSTHNPKVVLIDEVHERNVNIDVLISISKELIKEGTDVRFGLLSATTDASKWVNFYASTGILPPIIEIPGRTFPIERFESPESTVVNEAVKHAKDNKNILVFLPGVTEIEDTMSAIRKKLSGSRGEYVVLPLHGKLSSNEQQYVERLNYPGPKIICATNIAETSITIPDVDVVIDSGLERRIEIDEEGTASLRVRPVSQASTKQRSGRCGRTHDGVYVLTRLNERVEYVPFIQRPEYTEPEILRTNIDKTILSIACAGRDISHLDLPDHIDDKIILRSKAALRILGALDEDNNVTERGKRMNVFPVRPSSSRMLTYAEENNYDIETKSYLAALVACIESGGIPDYTATDKPWKKLSQETSSDLLAQLDMYLQVQEYSDFRDVSERGINHRALIAAREQHNKLLRRMGLRLGGEMQIELSYEQREKIRDCIVAGTIDFVYEARNKEYVRTAHRIKNNKKPTVPRELSDRSLIRGHPKLVTGTPYALSSPPGRNLPDKFIIQDVTKTTAEQLGRVAAHLCEYEPENDEITWRNGSAYSRQARLFRGTVPTGEFREKEVDWSRRLAEEIIRMAHQKPGKNLRQLNQLKRLSEELYHLTGIHEPIKSHAIVELLNQASVAGKIESRPMNPEMLDMELLKYIPEFSSHLPSEEAQLEIRNGSPMSIVRHGIDISIQYRHGQPLVAKVTDAIKTALMTIPGKSLTLDDDREVLIPHTSDKRKKSNLTLEELHRWYRI